MTTYDDIARHLTDGYAQWLGSARSAFDVGPGDRLDVDISALTAEGGQLARWALEAWTNVTGIRFRVTRSDDAHITFDDAEEGAFARWTSSGGRIVESNVNVSTEWLAEYGTSMDSYSFQTYIHEVGHALGLGHPGNYGADADEPPVTYGDDNLFANDSWQATVMSYFSQTTNTDVDASFAHVVTPMIADIIAVQDLYGVPADIHSGNTVYGSGSNVGGHLGELFSLIAGEDRDPDVYAGGPLTATIFDTGGTDTIDFRTDTADQRVDLRPEGISNVFGLTGNLVIARDTLIENFVAGSGDDRITGNAAANRLLGRAGDDSLKGGVGDDFLQGGAGDDTLAGDASDDRLRGGGGNDSLAGGAGDDTLAGHAGDDTLAGQAGDDRLWGGGGEDSLAGGADDDFIAGGHGGDHLRGGRGSDSLLGGTGDDRLVGDAGNDVLRGGAGSDHFVFDAAHGADMIVDFTDGHDRIDLSALNLARGIGDVTTTAVAAGVRIDLSVHGGGTILLRNFNLDSLGDSDFVL